MLPGPFWSWVPMSADEFSSRLTHLWVLLPLYALYPAQDMVQAPPPPHPKAMCIADIPRSSGQWRRLIQRGWNYSILKIK